MRPRLKLFLLSICSGILMGLSWPFTGSLTPLLFIAWIPMLFLEEMVQVKKWRTRKIIAPVYSGFIVFNLITCWWIYYASGGGMFMAVFVNALLMTLPFWLFHLLRRRMGDFIGYASFIVFWMCYEYYHYYWELSWPWLNLGNAFSIRTTWVQWYEFTGVAGGTLWVLGVNLTLFLAVKRYWLTRTMQPLVWRSLITGMVMIIIPIAVSLWRYASYDEKKDPIDVVVVQPNIDPYGDKFGGMSAFDQLTIFFRQAFLVGDSSAQFIVGPETVLPYTIVENDMDRQIQAADQNEAIGDEFGYLKRIFQIMPNTEMFLGMSSRKYFTGKEDRPKYLGVDHMGRETEYYNSSLFIDPEMSYSIYHKRYLVLGVEKIPFSGWIPAMNKLALSMGGSSQTLGSSPEPYVFKSKRTRAKIVTAICYESIYGAHLAEATRKGANALFVMTNDGWWEDTPGYKQHMSYARLRAIELRRSVARSANTGISCFIDQRGDVLVHSNWWEATALRKKINLNNSLTLYARTGDLLYQIAFYLTLSALLVYLYFVFTGKYALEEKEI